MTIKWKQIVAAFAVLLASGSQASASAAGKKIKLDVGAGVVNIKPVCLGDESALEVEVRLSQAPPFAECFATVEAPDLGILIESDVFETDDKGKGKIKGDIVAATPPVVGAEVEVAVTIVCSNMDEVDTFLVRGVVTFKKSCAEEEEGEDGE